MEKANSDHNQGAALTRRGMFNELAEAHGHYEVKCYDKDGNLKWEDVIDNVVCTEGKNSMLTNFLKGSAFTTTVRMGLIGNVSFSAVNATNVASAIATSASANGWNEATSSICASRGTPTFGTASAGSLALSSNQSFSIIGSDTIQGVFLLVPSAAAVAPTSTVANTSGALWSAGTFSGGSRAVINGDTLNVSYTTSL